jgi:MerR family transcriptional regulator, heat shock protein HspR
MDADDPIFPIAAAAELAGMHPQTLRQYDRLGLVVPRRTSGRSRRYSLREVAQLREVQRLSGEGVSLEGIRRVLELENEVVALRERVRQLETALANELLSRPGARVFASSPQGDVVPLRHGTRAARRTEMVVWRPRELDSE